MTVGEWLTALLRRWPVLVVGLLCTVGAVWFVHKRPVSYVSCASVLVGAPPTPSNPNFFNNTQGSLVAAAGLVTLEVQSQQVQQRLKAEGASGIYQAVVHNTGTTETPGYEEPEMDVCATSVDPDMSLRTTNAVVAEFSALLRARQVVAHVPRKYFLTDEVLAAPGAVPEVGRPSQAYLGVGVVGVITTASSALWIDQYLRRRRRKAREYDRQLTAASASQVRRT